MHTAARKQKSTTPTTTTAEDKHPTTRNHQIDYHHLVLKKSTKVITTTRTSLTTKSNDQLSTRETTVDYQVLQEHQKHNRKRQKDVDNKDSKVHDLRPSIEEQPGHPASVNLYNATIHTCNAQAPPLITAIPTISDHSNNRFRHKTASTKNYYVFGYVYDVNPNLY
eukprot:3411420-Amphidinium_carterae.2